MKSSSWTKSALVVALVALLLAAMVKIVKAEPFQADRSVACNTEIKQTIESLEGPPHHYETQAVAQAVSGGGVFVLMESESGYWGLLFIGEGPGGADVVCIVIEGRNWRER